jgi:hypothetical protein
MPAAHPKSALFIQSIAGSASDLVARAAAKAGVSLETLNSPTGITPLSATVSAALLRSAFVVADLTEANPGVMFEYGLATAQGKPVIVVSRGMRSLPPAAAAAHLFLAYEPDGANESFVESLARWMSRLLAGPNSKDTKALLSAHEKQHRVFVSYSHADREYLDRLLVHLKPLERDGRLDLWVDTQLRPGDKWQKAIENALTKATAAVLLVSADFMASDFIINNELPPLLRSAEERGTRIIPLLVKPSRFSRDSTLKHFQAANDPKRPLALLPHGDQELILDSVAEEIERWISAG